MRTAGLPSLFVFAAVCVALYGQPASAAPYRYRYVPLDNLSMPEGFAGFTFFLATIEKGDRVYGNFCNDAAVCYGAVYEDGAVTVLRPRHSAPPRSASPR